MKMLLTRLLQMTIEEGKMGKKTCFVLFASLFISLSMLKEKGMEKKGR